MFVITADQRGSRKAADLVPRAIDEIHALGAARLDLEPERTAGDEIQLATVDAGTVVAVMLALTRGAAWSAGIGIGDIEKPLPTSVRAARGTAFIRAREAIENAKRAPGRVAISGGPGSLAVSDAEAFARVVIELRDRRTHAGWEVRDLLSAGLSQRDAAQRLGISESAVSLRVRAAGLRVEDAAIPALVRALERAADDRASP